MNWSDIYGGKDAGKDTDKSGGNSAWGELIQGTIDGHEVTARIGNEGGPREGHTLITDGIVDRTTFNNHHDHIDAATTKVGDAGDRGNYTGPGSK